MEQSYKVTFYYKAKDSKSITAHNLESARKAAWDELEKDPECCANIVIAEYEKETPHKQSVMMERYRVENRQIIKDPF